MFNHYYQLHMCMSRNAFLQVLVTSRFSVQVTAGCGCQADVYHVEAPDAALYMGVTGDVNMCAGMWICICFVL